MSITLIQLILTSIIYVWRTFEYAKIVFSFVNFNLQVMINWILQHLPFIFYYFMVVEGPRRLSLVLWLFGTFVLGGAPKFETSFVNLIMPSFTSIKKTNLWQNMFLKKFDNVSFGDIVCFLCFNLHQHVQHVFVLLIFLNLNLDNLIFQILFKLP